LTESADYGACVLRQSASTLVVTAPQQGLHDITARVSDWMEQQDITTGLMTLFCRHTSASLLIQENAASAARRDLETWFARIAPEGSALYTHNDEGPDDMPAHIRAALTSTQIAIPVAQRGLGLGTWQGIYLFEHRRDPPPRQIALHLVGE
jgi:secondary thiamine-phosphate synthase enzyme